VTRQRRRQATGCYSRGASCILCEDAICSNACGPWDSVHRVCCSALTSLFNCQRIEETNWLTGNETRPCDKILTFLLRSVFESTRKFCSALGVFLCWLLLYIGAGKNATIRSSIGAPDVVRHYVIHEWFFLKLAKFYGHVDYYDKQEAMPSQTGRACFVSVISFTTIRRPEVLLQI